jgi:hypothetical protein
MNNKRKMKKEKRNILQEYFFTFPKVRKRPPGPMTDQMFYPHWLSPIASKTKLT